MAPWVGSGYGQQTAQATQRIAADGHDLAVSAYYGLAGGIMNWHGIKVLPGYAKHYGTDVLVPHALSHFGAGIGSNFRDSANDGLIITLGDVWTFTAPLLSDMNVGAWVPIDHETVPPAVLAWFGETGAIPIAMSRFGEKLLADAGLSPLYVPHGIDTNVFRPGDKAEARARVGLPDDAFVVAMVAANVGKDGARKAFYEQIVAFGELHRKHPDAVLAIHTDVASPYGVDLKTLLNDFPESAYHITDQYAYRVGVEASTIADIMRAADVLTNCSWGEGFGLTIIEAQACGTPVVVTDTTAMPELVGAGWKVPGEPMWHDSQQAWARRPFIAGIVDAYEKAYNSARDESTRALAWAHAQDYDADTVFAKYWRPALDHLAGAIEGRKADAGKTPAALPPIQLRQADGFTWIDRGSRTDDWIGWSHHEDSLRPVMEGLLPEGGVMLDVGAHIGRWSIRMSTRAVEVFAVEANPKTAATLRQHLALNDISNVTVLEFAAWDSNTYLTLSDPNHRLTGGSTRTLELPDHQVPVPDDVMASPLDDLFELDGLARLDLVKLDVEGSDLHALRGMRNLLAKHRPALIVERHDVYGFYRLDELTDLLAELGYQWEEVHYLTAPYLVCTPVERTE